MCNMYTWEKWQDLTHCTVQHPLGSLVLICWGFRKASEAFPCIRYSNPVTHRHRLGCGLNCGCLALNEKRGNFTAVQLSDGYHRLRAWRWEVNMEQLTSPFALWEMVYVYIVPKVTEEHWRSGQRVLLLSYLGNFGYGTLGLIFNIDLNSLESMALASTEFSHYWKQSFGPKVRKVLWKTLSLDTPSTFNQRVPFIPLLLYGPIWRGAGEKSSAFITFG